MKSIIAQYSGTWRFLLSEFYLDVSDNALLPLLLALMYITSHRPTSMAGICIYLVMTRMLVCIPHPGVVILR